MYNKSHFVLSQTSSHSSSLHELERAPEHRDMFRPYNVSLNVYTGWLHGRGMTLNPRYCTQWMDPKVTSTRSTDRLWRNCRIRN